MSSACDPGSCLLGLFLASFLAATLLPGGSEAALLLVLHAEPGLVGVALAVATLGNTLGGMSSYLIGRFLPRAPQGRAAGLAQRWGSPSLLLAWAPLIGDALCVAAGWVRLDWRHAAGFMALGKLVRYWAVAQAVV